MKYYRYNSIYIFSKYVFEDSQLKELTRKFQRPFRPSQSVLGGRSDAVRISFPNIGPMIIKQYRRGGLLNSIVKQKYLRLGKPRCQLEYDYLSRLRSLGVKVPEPIAYAFKGTFIYQAWLITREIPDISPLAAVQADDSSEFEAIIDSLVEQVSILIDHGIFHPDFHPGNALVDSKNSIYLLDFDKASFYQGSKKRLEKKYIIRWQRAVSKHGLPKRLAGAFPEKLTRYRSKLTERYE